MVDGVCVISRWVSCVRMEVFPVKGFPRRLARKKNFGKWGGEGGGWGGST